MPRKSFCGTIQQVLYSGEQVSQPRDRSFPLNFGTSPITWNAGQTIPPILIGRTINQIQALPGTSLETNICIRTSGVQYQVAGSVPTIRMAFIYPPDGAPRYFYKTAPVGGCFDIGDKYYSSPPEGDCPENLRGGVPRSVNVAIYNRNPSGCAGSIDYPARNLNVTVIFRFCVVLECVGEGLTTTVCESYCSNNLNECQPDFLDFCFAEDRISDPGRTGEVCRSFLQKTVPSVELSSRLRNYCHKTEENPNGKYTNLAQLVNSADSEDKSLCACHMPLSDYENFRRGLNDILPGLSDISIDPRCLIAPCVTSPFKYDAIGPSRQCPVPACLNIFALKNDGTIDRTVIDPVQASDCLNIATPSPGPTPSRERGTNWGLIIGIILGVLILIIVIVIIVVLVRSQSTPVPQSTSFNPSYDTIQ